MDVLVIAQYFPPDFGGASTRAYNAARGLVLQGCNVTVITAFPHYPHGKIPESYRGKFLVREEKEGMTLLRTWVPRLPHSSVSNRIRLHLAFITSCFFVFARVRKVDIVFAMNPNLFSFFPAWFYGTLFRKRIIRNVDDLWPEVFYELGIVKSSLSKRVLDYLASISYHKSCVIIPLSQGYVQTIASKYHVNPEKIVVIEQGVDTTVFRKAEKAAGHTSKKIVMYSGALTIGYDFDTVIRAAKILESQPIHFIIRGVGDVVESIRQWISENEIKNVELQTELLPIQELISILNSADIFLLPMSSVVAIDQGFPTKILEYQALGKPIVCSSNGEAGRYITVTKTGLVTAPGKPEALAEAIFQLVNNESYARELGENGSRNIQANLTVEAVGKRLMQVIDNCTSRGR